MKTINLKLEFQALLIIALERSLMQEEIPFKSPFTMMQKKMKYGA
jgi:hypothetical protein